MKTSTTPTKPWNKRGPKIAAGGYDTIVIGSGMGGMTAAALLSETGERVLVLEQHYEPGGYTHTFKRPGGYRWDVGVHAIGEVTRHSMIGRILHRLTAGQLTWSSLGEVYDHFHFPDGFEVGFPDSPQGFRERLYEAFPDDHDVIDGYFEAVRDVAGSMRRYYLSRVFPARVSSVADQLFARQAQHYFQQSAADVLASLTDNPKLRAVLASQWGYYGAKPARASFAMQALVAKHFMWGGYYPVGGSAEIARQLLSTVARHGGWTRIATPVDEILFDDDDRAIGVRVGDQEIHAPRVISGVGVQATVQRLLPERLRTREWAQSFLELEPAAAHVCVYLGFKGDIAAAGAGAANQWFYDTWDHFETEVWDIDPDADTQPRIPVLYCSFPSLKDPEHDPGADLKHTGEIVTFVPWEAFSQWKGSCWKKRGEAYDAFKAQLKDALLEQFFERRPELRPLLDIAEVSTPLSTDHFNGAPGGSIYGLAPTPARYANRWLRPKAPVPGLYFAGCDVSAPGVIGAMFGGVLAALAAKPLPVGRYLRPMM